MRLSLFRPTTNYLLFDKVLKSGVFPQRVQQCILQQGKNSVSAAPVVICSKKIFQRSDTAFFNLGGLGHLSASYCTNPEQRTQLMRNFPFCYGHPVFKYPKVFIKQFAVKMLDWEFGLIDFVDNALEVLKIVTPLIAEGKFSELEGLLTEDCLNEVVFNVKNLELSKRKLLEVTSDTLIGTFPFSLDVIRVPEGDKQRIFVEIIVVYYIFKNTFTLTDILDKRGMDYLTIYNIKFIREFTPKVDDQWTISAINVYLGVENIPEF